MAVTVNPDTHAGSGFKRLLIAPPYLFNTPACSAREERRGYDLASMGSPRCVSHSEDREPTDEKLLAFTIEFLNKAFAR